MRPRLPEGSDPEYLRTPRPGLRVRAARLARPFDAGAVSVRLTLTGCGAAAAWSGGAETWAAYSTGGLSCY